MKVTYESRTSKTAVKPGFRKREIAKIRAPSLEVAFGPFDLENPGDYLGGYFSISNIRVITTR
jgi:hypothetical protein